MDRRGHLRLRVKRVETSDNPRVGTLLELVRETSRASSPRDVAAAFGRHFWKIRPTQAMVSASVRGLEPGRYKVTRLVDMEDGSRTIPIDPWKDWARLPTHRGGFIGALIAEPIPRLLHHLDVRGDPAIGDFVAGLGSCMAIPLFDGGEALNWSFQFRRDPEGFSVKELEDAILIANLVGGTNGKLILVEQVKRLNDALRRQFDEVARVQRSLLPRQLPTVPGLELAASYVTSNEAGGDYYDFIPMPDGRWGIMIADVAGHGAAAATVMAMLHAIIHGYPGPKGDPADVLAYTNRRLIEARLENSFVTAFFAVYDPRSATLTYASSGHNAPLLKDGRTGAVATLDGATTFPLGVLEAYEPRSARVTLRPRDTVVLYTDGITEAFDAERRMFGVEGLDRALTDCSGDPDCVISSVHAALYRHTGSLGRADDQTLVAMRYTGASP